MGALLTAIRDAITVGSWVWRFAQRHAEHESHHMYEEPLLAEHVKRGSPRGSPRTLGPDDDDTEW